MALAHVLDLVRSRGQRSHLVLLRTHTQGPGTACLAPVPQILGLPLRLSWLARQIRTRRLRCNRRQHEQVYLQRRRRFYSKVERHLRSRGPVTVTEKAVSHSSRFPSQLVQALLQHHAQQPCQLLRRQLWRPRHRRDHQRRLLLQWQQRRRQQPRSPLAPQQMGLMAGKVRKVKQISRKKKNPRESFWTSELPVPRSAVAISAAARSAVLPLAGERSLTGNSSLSGVVEADGTSGPASGRS